jgi:hypothetical protein
VYSEKVRIYSLQKRQDGEQEMLDNEKSRLAEDECL